MSVVLGLLLSVRCLCCKVVGGLATGKIIKVRVNLYIGRSRRMLCSFRSIDPTIKDISVSTSCCWQSLHSAGIVVE